MDGPKQSIFTQPWCGERKGFILIAVWKDLNFLEWWLKLWSFNRYLGRGVVKAMVLRVPLPLLNFPWRHVCIYFSVALLLLIFHPFPKTLYLPALQPTLIFFPSPFSPPLPQLSVPRWLSFTNRFALLDVFQPPPHLLCCPSAHFSLSLSLSVSVFYLYVPHRNSLFHPLSVSLPLSTAS